MRVALLIVQMGSHFTELVRVAQMLKRAGSYEPAFFFEQTYPTIDSHLAHCQAEGITCFNSSGKVMNLPVVDRTTPRPELNRPPSKDTGWRRTLRDWFRRHLPQPVVRYALARILFGIEQYVLRKGLVSVPFWMRRYWRRVRFAEQFIARQQVAIVIAAVDVPAYSASEWVRAAHRQSAPAVIVPFAMTSSDTLAAGLLHREEFHLHSARLRDWLVARLYPQWVYHYRGQALLMLPAARALARQWLHLASPRPWVYNSSNADAVAAESKYMLQHYRREGLPAERLVLTGALYDDVLAAYLETAATRRAELCAELGLPPDRLLVLCALPPDQFAVTGMQMRSDFATYADMVQFWVQSLAALPGCNVVIRLHPRMKYEDLRYIEQWGVTIASHDTAALIPLCDIYVTSFSATIRWAIACGKPVVNYDVFRSRHAFYAEAGGVLTVEEQEDFTSTLQQLVRDPAALDDITRRQVACMQHWGNLDGQAAARMHQLFDNLVAKKNRKRIEP